MMGENSEIVGVILAGGRGTRMFPFSDRYPKPLLPICNKPLVVYQIEMMKELGVRDVFILVGHKGFQLSMMLGNGSCFGVRINYVEQTEILGIAHAVGRLEPYINHPFLLFLGDIFFVPRDLSQMVTMFREQGDGAVLAVKEEPDPAAIRKNYSVVLDASGRVRRVIEKPRHTINRLKGVGLYLFDLSVFDAVRRTPRTAMRDEYEITDTIQVMIDDGLTVRVANSVLNDVNITSPADLLDCNLLEAARRPGSHLIGPGCVVHSGAVVENCVLGANVHIRHPIQLRRTVVFDNVAVDSETNFDGFILTPEAVLNCGYGQARVSSALVSRTQN